MFAWTKTMMFAVVLSLLATVVAGDLCGQKAPKDPKARIMATFLLPDGKPAKSLQVAFFCWADYSEDPIAVRATTNLFGMASFKGTRPYSHVTVGVEDKKWAMPYTGSARLGKPYKSKALDLGTITLTEGGSLNVEILRSFSPPVRYRDQSHVVRPVGSVTDKNYTFIKLDSEGTSKSALAPGRYELVSSAEYHVIPSKAFNIEANKSISVSVTWIMRRGITIDVDEKIRTSGEFSCWAEHLSGELPDLPKRMYDLSGDKVIFNIVKNEEHEKTRLKAGITSRLFTGKWRIYGSYKGQTVFEDTVRVKHTYNPIKLVFDDPARHGLKITATTQSGEAFSGAKVYVCKKGTSAYEFAAAAKVGDYAVDRDFGSDTIGHLLDTNAHTSAFLPAFESGLYSLVVVDELRLVAGVLKDFEVASSGLSKANIVAEPILIQGIFLEKGEPYANQKVWLSSDLKRDDAALYTDVNGVANAEVQKPGAYTFYTEAERAWVLARKVQSKTDAKDYFNWVFAVWAGEPIVRRELSSTDWTWVTLKVTTASDQEPRTLFFTQAPQKKKKGGGDSINRLAYQQHRPEVLLETEATYNIGPIRVGDYAAQIENGTGSGSTAFSFSAAAQQKQTIKLDITPRKLTVTVKLKGFTASGELAFTNFSASLHPASDHFPQSLELEVLKLNKSGKVVFEKVPDGQYILHVSAQDKFRRVKAATTQFVEIKGDKKITAKISNKNGSIYAQFSTTGLTDTKPFPEFLMPKYKLMNKRGKIVPFAFPDQGRWKNGRTHVRVNNLPAGDYKLVVSGWGFETTTYPVKVSAGIESRVNVNPPLSAYTSIVVPEALSPEMALCVEYIKINGAKYDQPESGEGLKYPCFIWQGKHLLLVNQSKAPKSIKLKLRGLKEITLNTNSLDIVSKIGSE